MEYRISFRGTAKEFFGIWIVNMLLQTVTLGFYTAWAKVRKRRYFAGNTIMEGESFEYLADPKALFRGWLIAAAGVVLYLVVSRLSPRLGVLVGIAIAGAMPWIIVKSCVFNLRNLAWRNIRFNFRPDYGQAYLVYLGLAALAGATFGIMAPYMLYRQKRFQVDNRLYGSTPFRFTATPGDFYRIFLRLLLWMLPLGILIGVLVAAFGPGRSLGVKSAVIVPFIFIGVYLFLFAYMKTELANLVWNKTELGPVRFNSTLNFMTIFWLYLSGAVGVICSLGMLFPWAAVRLTRYRYDRFAIHAPEGMEGFFAEAQAAVGAAGEEIGDMLGMDLDIGF